MKQKYRPTLILTLAANDCKSRFAGSVLGGVWAFVSPAVTVCLYWFVYTIALKGTPIEGVPYILWLISGIIPWFFFADGLCGAASCFWDYRFPIRKIKFNPEYLPLIRILSAFFVHIVFTVFAYLLLLISGIALSAGQLWALYWLSGNFLLILGLGKIVSVLCVYLKDLAYGINVLVRLGFWITPIFWSASALPVQLFRLVFLNPAAIAVQGFREALLFGKNLDIRMQLFFWLVTAAINLIACLLMKKLKPILTDRL